MQTTEHWIDIDGGRLFTKVYMPGQSGAPSRPTILLFHDSLGCVDLWRDFPAQLASATALRVVAYDRLGFGRSSPHPGTLASDFIHAEATQVVPALCNDLGLGALIPFGHSVGGAMAVASAGFLAGRCSAVVTMSAQAFVEDLTLSGIREAQRAFDEPAQLERLARYHGAKAPWVLSAWVDTWLAPGFAGWTLAPDLARVQCPLLATHGDRDEYGSQRHPELIASGTAGPSEAVILEDCGHVPYRERAEAVLQAVTRFLAAQRSSWPEG